MSIYMYIHLSIHIYICMHIYIYMCTHIYIYIRISDLGVMGVFVIVGTGGGVIEGLFGDSSKCAWNANAESARQPPIKSF